MMDTVVHMVDVPAKQIPPFKYQIAMKAGIKQIMMTTWGGLGDQVCGEPSLRYAFELFPEYKISLITSFPDLFTHLPFERIYSKDEVKELNENEWLVIHTNPRHENMARDFLQHHFTQPVDFASICAFQRQLPIAKRQIVLPKTAINPKFKNAVVIHPGRHWQSKTFPEAWWDEVIARLGDNYERVVVIGKDIDAETGTVDVTIPKGVIDLRNKLNVIELATVLQFAEVVITNDSAPLHMGTVGDAFIFFVATCKDAEHLTHWRHSMWGWRMMNLGVDEPWLFQHSCPVRSEPLSIDTMPEERLLGSLPKPRYVVREVAQAMHVIHGL